MIITCPSCKKKFNIDINLIPAEGRNLQCGSCDRIWFYKKDDPIPEPPQINEDIAIKENEESDNSDNDKYNEVDLLWKSVGSHTKNIPTDNHDELITFLSHGPHAISFVLSNITPLLKDHPWTNTKGSLAEMIRVANSDPEAWANIFKDNQDNLLRYIKSIENADQLDGGEGAIIIKLKKL